MISPDPRGSSTSQCDTPATAERKARTRTNATATESVSPNGSAGVTTKASAGRELSSAINWRTFIEASEEFKPERVIVAPDPTATHFAASRDGPSWSTVVFYKDESGLAVKLTGYWITTFFGGQLFAPYA
jgi:glutamate 5-kinase